MGSNFPPACSRSSIRAIVLPCHSLYIQYFILFKILFKIGSEGTISSYITFFRNHLFIFWSYMQVYLVIYIAPFGGFLVGPLMFNLWQAANASFTVSGRRVWILVVDYSNYGWLYFLLYFCFVNVCECIMCLKFCLVCFVSMFCQKLILNRSIRITMLMEATTVWIMLFRRGMRNRLNTLPIVMIILLMFSTEYLAYYF